MLYWLVYVCLVLLSTSSRSNAESCNAFGVSMSVSKDSYIHKSRTSDYPWSDDDGAQDKGSQERVNYRVVCEYVRPPESGSTHYYVELDGEKIETGSTVDDHAKVITDDSGCRSDFSCMGKCTRITGYIEVRPTSTTFNFTVACTVIRLEQSPDKPSTRKSLSYLIITNTTLTSKPTTVQSPHSDSEGRDIALYIITVLLTLYGVAVTVVCVIVCAYHCRHKKDRNVVCHGLGNFDFLFG